jgi:hypothetical protein
MCFVEMNAPSSIFLILCAFLPSAFVLECTGNGASHKMNHYGKLLYIFPSALQYTTPMHYHGFDAPSSQNFDMENWVV